MTDTRKPMDLDDDSDRTETDISGNEHSEPEKEETQNTKKRAVANFKHVRWSPSLNQWLFYSATGKAPHILANENRRRIKGDPRSKKKPSPEFSNAGFTVRTASKNFAILLQETKNGMEHPYTDHPDDFLTEYLKMKLSETEIAQLKTERTLEKSLDKKAKTAYDTLMARVGYREERVLTRNRKPTPKNKHKTKNAASSESSDISVASDSDKPPQKTRKKSQRPEPREEDVQQPPRKKPRVEVKNETEQKLTDYLTRYSFFAEFKKHPSEPMQEAEKLLTDLFAAKQAEKKSIEQAEIDYQAKMLTDLNPSTWEVKEDALFKTFPSAARANYVCDFYSKKFKNTDMVFVAIGPDLTLRFRKDSDFIRDQDMAMELFIDLYPDLTNNLAKSRAFKSKKP